MDEQEKLQRLALEKCNVAFVNKLDVAALLPHLISRHLLTDDDKQLLMREVNTKAQKAQYLLDIIPRKGKGWFESLLECLRESANGTGHRDLVKELETKFQEVLEKNVTKNKKLGGRQASTEQTQQPVGGGQANEREDVSDAKNHTVYTYNPVIGKGSVTLSNHVHEILKSVLNFSDFSDLKSLMKSNT